MRIISTRYTRDPDGSITVTMTADTGDLISYTTAVPALMRAVAAAVDMINTDIGAAVSEARGAGVVRLN